ncbi:Kae1-associated kinase Bud32 [Fervidicoccus fontis]|uniref:non-specific serine/threonine protein kinase n=1 Tax=Fervidicoccus fontis TaxID=683846 RepID=A0A7C2VCC6_9CREN|nr:Kae1-associated kinase Bud32 [Fervidicoccus fontis]PMB76418.1 MAG: Kae1-associated kinase Bud32 [Fervidicoccus fontis]HEW63828.1 Kae1-associated kinase Bud32 [Fervidicoccus fontis]
MEGVRLEKKPLSWGAESNLYLIEYLNDIAVLKERIIKPYMDPRLAKSLISKRTSSEARILMDCIKAGIRVPYPLKVDAENGLLIISYISGEVFRDYLNEKGFDELAKSIVFEVANSISKMHNLDIIHGDLTTSNIIIKDGNAFIIDFGLSFRSKREEDKAMDLRIFERAVESTHPEYKEKILEPFFSTYFKNAAGSEKIRKSLEDIRLRGRYVRERRGEI